MTQADVKESAREIFRGAPELDRHLALFDRAGVDMRYFAFPKSYYLDGKPFGRRNDDYIRVGQTLGEEAVRRALLAAHLEPRDVDAFLFTTTTGLATPSLDALLAPRLGFRLDVRRIPLFGLGCAGGAGILALAADHLRHRPDGVAVALSVELCSLTLLIHEATVTNLVGVALFGDGAAAAVLTGGNRSSNGPAVAAAETALFPESSHLMGWRFSEAGFGLELSPAVPAFVAEELPSRVREFLGRHGQSPESIRHFALHPGGRQVLEAYRRGFGLSAEALAPTREALRKVGNLSSASVFFSLREVMDTAHPQAGDTGFLAALGPGFAAEMMLLRW